MVLYWAYSLDLGMVYEFDLLVRGLHPWLVIRYGLSVVEASCWGFMEEIILAQFTSRGVCRRTWYRLWFAWFLLFLVIFLDVQFHLHWIWDWLNIVITGLCSCMSCERWHGYSFISFLCWLWRTWESIGDLLWELFLQDIGICIVDVLETAWIHVFEMLWVDWLYPFPYVVMLAEFGRWFYIRHIP